MARRFSDVPSFGDIGQVGGMIVRRLLSCRPCFCGFGPCDFPGSEQGIGFGGEQGTEGIGEQPAIFRPYANPAAARYRPWRIRRRDFCWHVREQERRR